MFLDNVVDVVYEIEYGTARRYPGNYTNFIARKKENYDKQMKDHIVQQKEIERLQRMVTRFKGKPTKTAMAQSKQKAIDRMVIIEAPDKYDNKTFHANFQPEKETGNDVLYTSELAIGYDHPLSVVSLDLKRGEKLGILGGNGLGKSTFLKTLNRMNDLIEGVKIDGEVYLDGANIFTEMDDITLRHRVGMVFQQPNPFPKSIYDNIAYGPRLFGVHKKAELDIIVEKALKQAAIWDEVKDRLKKSALGLSGGQQQRLCIARTLAVEPEVILMDEPTSALDPISTSRIEDLAIELKNDYTIIMVTHNMQQATRISDNTAFFLLGEMIEYDKTEQLFSMPKNKKTEDYITGRFG